MKNSLNYRKKYMLLIGKWLLAIALISMVVLSGVYCGKNNSKETPTETLFVSLDEEFVLHKNQFAIVKGEDFAVTIDEFYNSPAVPGDIWSGIGIAFLYYHAGEVEKGIDLVKAFGYQTSIIDTDYETFAKLKIYKIS